VRFLVLSHFGFLISIEIHDTRCAIATGARETECGSVGRCRCESDDLRRTVTSMEYPSFSAHF
jgi:hypothetical protein